MKKIDLVIFDWAGTTVDYGCFAPVQAFQEAFAAYGIEVNDKEVREPMGLLKREHIRTMLAMERIASCFQQVYGRKSEEKDIEAIYALFETKLMETLDAYTKLKPYVLETMTKLRHNGYLIGSTTGYTDRMMRVVTSRAKAQGYEPDTWVSPDSTEGMGRPYPFMIFENMKRLRVPEVHRVVKVGDTLSDIREGKQAGVISIGVLEGSSQVGLSEAEYEMLDAIDKETRLHQAEEAFFNAGADYVIRDLRDLLPLLENIEK